MRGQYPTRRGFRPRPSGRAMRTGADCARFFLCGFCRAHALVCSGCDRGQVYCSKGCAQEVRRRALREAGRRYQTSPRGRRKHALRTARYRARLRLRSAPQNKVTHQGSPARPPDVLLAPDPAAANEPPSASGEAGRPAPEREFWRRRCRGRRCPALVRRGFPRRRGPQNAVQYGPRGAIDDNFP